MLIDTGKDTFEINPFCPGNSIGKYTIYTIWTFDPSSDDYQLVFVGRTETERELIDKDNVKYTDWSDYQIGGLYIGTRQMSDEVFTKEERKEEEKRLIETYRPLCNAT